MSISDQKFKKLMSQFASGVTIVTAERDGKITGLTVSSFASVSLDPSLVLICIENEARTNEQLMKGSGFTVNILTEEQESLSNKFAQPGLTMEERLEGESYSRVEVGGPVLTESVAWLECEQYDRHESGDHTIYVGKVLQGDLLNHADPLLYHQGDYGSLSSS